MVVHPSVHESVARVGAIERRARSLFALSRRRAMVRNSPMPISIQRSFSRFSFHRLGEKEKKHSHTFCIQKLRYSTAHLLAQLINNKKGKKMNVERISCVCLFLSFFCLYLNKKAPNFQRKLVSYSSSTAHVTRRVVCSSFSPLEK